MLEPSFEMRSEERTAEEKQAVLDETKPKIVDEKKYHGAAVTDFRAIRERMKQL